MDQSITSSYRVNKSDFLFTYEAQQIDSSFLLCPSDYMNHEIYAVRRSVKFIVQSTVQSNVHFTVQSTIQFTVQSTVQSIVQSTVQSTVQFTVQKLTPVRAAVQNTYVSPLRFSAMWLFLMKMRLNLNSKAWKNFS